MEMTPEEAAYREGFNKGYLKGLGDATQKEIPSLEFNYSKPSLFSTETELVAIWHKDGKLMRAVSTDKGATWTPTDIPEVYNGND